jgi:hypothetical protein
MQKLRYLQWTQDTGRTLKPLFQCNWLAWDMLPKWITKKIIPRCLRKVSHTFVSNFLHIMLGIRRKCEMELLFKNMCCWCLCCCCHCLLLIVLVLLLCTAVAGLCCYWPDVSWHVSCCCWHPPISLVSLLRLRMSVACYCDFRAVSVATSVFGFSGFHKTTVRFLVTQQASLCVVSTVCKEE